MVVPFRRTWQVILFPSLQLKWTDFPCWPHKGWHQELCRAGYRRQQWWKTKGSITCNARSTLRRGNNIFHPLMIKAQYAKVPEKVVYVICSVQICSFNNVKNMGSFLKLTSTTWTSWDSAVANKHLISTATTVPLPSDDLRSSWANLAFCWVTHISTCMKNTSNKTRKKVLDFFYSVASVLFAFFLQA